jgi:hypothetical protein
MREPRTKAERRIPSRIATVDGSMLFIAGWHHFALERNIDRAKREGYSHIRLDGRAIQLDRIAAVLPPVTDENAA